MHLSGQAGSETVRTLSELYAKVPNFEHLVQGADGTRLRYVDLIRHGEEDGKRQAVLSSWGHAWPQAA